jgi:hypothetical protein
MLTIPRVNNQKIEKTSSPNKLKKVKTLEHKKDRAKLTAADIEPKNSDFTQSNTSIKSAKPVITFSEASSQAYNSGCSKKENKTTYFRELPSIEEKPMESDEYRSTQMLSQQLPTITLHRTSNFQTTKNPHTQSSNPPNCQ